MNSRPKGHGSEHWYTPVRVADAVRDAFGGSIDLDPYSSAEANAIVRADRFIDRHEDGLRADWGDARTIYANPPFGDGIGVFIEAVVQHVDARVMRQAIVLVPPNIDAAWWQTYAPVACWTLCLSGRLAFRSPDGGSQNGNTKGSVLWGFGGFMPPQVPSLPGVLYGPALRTIHPPRTPFADALAGHRAQAALM